MKTISSTFKLQIWTGGESSRRLVAFVLFHGGFQLKVASVSHGSSQREAGADVEAEHNDGDTPLHSMVEVEAGANVKAKNTSSLSRSF
mmetsp:Transcript_10384/g.22902  ORF Transcript_10384/g.22902 Transcript_10384/m.22902 type:complete len:88 (+) Transcript_10384:475-738(+)